MEVINVLFGIKNHFIFILNNKAVTNAEVIMTNNQIFFKGIKNNNPRNTSAKKNKNSEASFLELLLLFLNKIGKKSIKTTLTIRKVNFCIIILLEN